jgi:manganese/zinc/iron transport system substrate-binding protein
MMAAQALRKLAGVLVLAAVATAMLVGGCADSAADVETNEGRYDIVCTVSMITDIVRQVAGDRANVTGLLSEGTDPHTYSPTRSDVIKLMEADVVFYNGLMLEGKMADVFVRVARSGKRVYAVTDKLQDEGYIMTDEADHYDPHVWMDVQGWIKAVRAVADALSEYDAPGTESYGANAERYIAELEAIDAYAKKSIASIPVSQRVLITAHDAFSYFGRAYDVEVRGIQGISTESEAGLRDLNDLVNDLVERKIGAVFVETSVADKYVNALIEGAEAQGHTVTIGGRLFSDAMGAPGSYEGTYIGMIDHNVTTITRALGGDAPARGMQGKLSDESN